MKVKFLQDFKYIQNGTVFNFKNFSVITGENGSGKTNILKGINNPGGVQINDEINSKLDIRYFAHNHFETHFREKDYGVSTRLNTGLHALWEKFKTFDHDGRESFNGFDEVARYAGKNPRELKKVDFVNFSSSTPTLNE